MRRREREKKMEGKEEEYSGRDGRRIKRNEWKENEVRGKEAEQNGRKGTRRKGDDIKRDSFCSERIVLELNVGIFCCFQYKIMD